MRRGAGSAESNPGPAGSGSGTAGPAASDPVPADGTELTGPALARAVLDAAMARRKAGGSGRRTWARGEVTGDSTVGDGPGEAGGAPATGRGGKPRRRPRGYSGPGPDPRDPQLFGAVLARMVKARGWQQPAAEATVFGAWERVVGPDIAEHSRPIKLEDGELTVEAESTAWATQLRLLAGSLLRRIAAEVGHNVVRRLHVHGPTAPSWVRGPRRVRGRGPRDTYG
ncbi:DUF721 domain-containing protein [Plantactinospora soyae]